MVSLLSESDYFIFITAAQKKPGECERGKKLKFCNNPRMRERGSQCIVGKIIPPDQEMCCEMLFSRF